MLISYYFLFLLKSPAPRSTRRCFFRRTPLSFPVWYLVTAQWGQNLTHSLLWRWWDLWPSVRSVHQTCKPESYIFWVPTMPLLETWNLALLKIHFWLEGLHISKLLHLAPEHPLVGKQKPIQKRWRHHSLELRCQALHHVHTPNLTLLAQRLWGLLCHHKGKTGSSFCL